MMKQQCWLSVFSPKGLVGGGGVVACSNRPAARVVFFCISVHCLCLPLGWDYIHIIGTVRHVTAATIIFLVGKQ